MCAEKRCVACGGRLALFGHRSDYEYHRCLVCRTIQLVPMPDKTELAKAYENRYAAADHYNSRPVECVRSAQTYYQALIDTLNKYRVDGPVLDYGSGWGGLCKLLIDTGFECRGIDMSEQMVNYCRQQALPVEHGDITSLEENGFSALVLCTVFEHLVDHHEWMAQANRVLRQDGLLVTLQPTARFAGFVGRLARIGTKRVELPHVHRTFCPPWHTAFFSVEGIRTLAPRHGFELIEVRPAPQGRERGLIGLSQLCLETLNKAGWRVAGQRWPLLTSHIFVLRKTCAPPEGGTQ